jgi:hypothetical protein
VTEVPSAPATSPLAGRWHSSEDGLKTTHSDADEAPAAAEGGERIAPGFPDTRNLGKVGVMPGNTSKRYPAELKARAVSDLFPLSRTPELRR